MSLVGMSDKQTCFLRGPSGCSGRFSVLRCDFFLVIGSGTVGKSERTKADWLFLWLWLWLQYDYGLNWMMMMDDGSGSGRLRGVRPSPKVCI